MRVRSNGVGPVAAIVQPRVAQSAAARSLARMRPHHAVELGPGHFESNLADSRSSASSLVSASGWQTNLDIFVLPFGAQRSPAADAREPGNLRRPGSCSASSNCIDARPESVRPARSASSSWASNSKSSRLELLIGPREYRPLPPRRRREWKGSPGVWAALGPMRRRGMKIAPSHNRHILARRRPTSGAHINVPTTTRPRRTPQHHASPMLLSCQSLLNNQGAAWRVILESAFFRVNPCPKRHLVSSAPAR
jgi:hypothetical protein